MDRIETVVVGAGVVGLAVARALALAGQEVVVLEAAEGIGSGISARNSEVIHAGIYYPKNSLKARLCVEGRHLLYAYVESRGVTHRRLGKLIVAGPDQLDALSGIAAAAQANGVDDLETWRAAQVAEAEPQVRAAAALWSPSTGIVDSHGLMLAYLGDLESAGGALALNAPLLSAEATADGFSLEVGGPDPMRLSCARLVNAAGLDAPDLARRIEGAAPPAALPRAHYAKGSYFALHGVKCPFRHLVYPIPEPGGLGVHATLDLAGQARFGPDVEWVDPPLDYRVNPARAEKFYAAIRAYWPGLPDASLAPAYSGVRPKISGPGEPAADFTILGPETAGAPGLVHLLGIESPGLTSSLAIAERVRDLLVD